jgi:hypothetical protein
MFESGAGVVVGLTDHVGTFGHRKIWPTEESDVFFHEQVHGFKIIADIRITLSGRSETFLRK